MARYSVQTRLSPEESIVRAVAYFGPGGLGLEVSDQAECCVTFRGGGGHVWANATTEAKKTTVELETREWDIQGREFMRKIG